MANTVTMKYKTAKFKTTSFKFSLKRKSKLKER
uniref:Uncharacterized protein n=1 Tax=Rhizophora mucronata TaxID=61149 RepID=A0A2P2QW66_RHIMU